MEIADYIVAEDRRLVELVLEGDDTAFEYLFNRYRDAIHRLFVQRLGGVNDADDLLQETFIKVYINLHRYSTDYTFGQWVYTIARNTFIDFVRRRQDDLPIDERFAAPASNAPTPEESVINLQQRYATGGGIACPARLQMFAAVQVDGFKGKRQAFFLQSDIDRHHVR